ncbi:unnamed protein product [Ostreobium quekettii]|uniref:ubiquitinyl hydrolase 1 n=1 Tax=Ostreobium quekettii TaxID=121088 RepID=A0A8S1IT82_9CHLO|nr:unnamed protein product [Ostreobium quekettii]
MGATDSGRRQSAARPGQTAQQENGKVTVGERSHGGRQFGATSPLLAKATPARKAAPGPGPQGQAGASLRPMQAGRELHRSNTTQRVPSVPSPTSHVQLRASEASNAGGDRRKEPLQHRSAPVSGSRRVKQVPGQPLGPKVISEPSDRDCHCSSAPELNGLRVEADRDEGNNFPTSTHELPEFDQNGSHLQDHQEGAAMHASNSELLSPLSGPQANRHSSLSPTGTTGSDPSLPGEEPGKKSGKRRNRRRSSKKSRPIPSGVPGADFVDAPALPPTAFSQGLRPDRGASSPAPGVHVHHQPDVGPRRVAPCDAQQHDVESHDMSYVSAWPTGSAPAELWGVGDDMTASTLANANMAGFVSAASPRTSQQPQAACVPIVTEKESGDDQEMLSRQPQSPQVKDALKALCSDTFPGNGIRFYECGITNLGNTCFVGSALQLLLASRRFCWLLKQLSIVSHCLNPHMLPTLVGLGELAKGLTERGGQRKPQAAAQQGCHGWASGRTAKPVMPIMLSTVVNRFQQRHAQSTLGGLAEEHDAQEFLLYLLEQMEVELLKLKEAVLVGQGSPSPREIQQDDDDWEVAGRKGKSATKRTAGSQAESMLSAIFGGSVQSEVKASKMKPSIVVHRFTALDLDIAPKKVNTIEDALQLYTEPDHLTDYRPTDTSKPQTATKANRLRDLPQVLLVSLKRYAYTEDGLQKIHKRIGFGSMLTIQRQWLAESKPIRADYRLVATCSHHGRGHGGDHYTANVLQPVGMWLNFNDSVINQMLWRDVENDAPYMLLYERASK